MFTGLERIAEELMGRRKWHQYQDILAKNYLLEEELMDRREWVPVKTYNSCDVNTDLSVADHSPAELVIETYDNFYLIMIVISNETSKNLKNLENPDFPETLMDKIFY